VTGEIESTEFEGLLRDLAPQVLGALVRRTGDFDGSEDAVQEALLAASTQWPRQGLPSNPKGWLITVASRRRIELVRQDAARRRREETAALLADPAPETLSEVDDSLALLMLCCHPSLTPVSQVALTLRAVGGLTTAEIARALLVPEATVAQRISRAKQRIKASGAEFRMPAPDERPARIAAVLHVLYLVFNEGYTATAGDDLVRRELCDEAIRLGKLIAVLMPDEPEVLGLLALMLFHDSRREARTGPDGELILLEDQDRSLWSSARIEEGRRILERAVRLRRPGPYQLQAAISAVHADTLETEQTDWPVIATLYEQLARMAPSPIVELNRAVAVALAGDPEDGLDLIAAIDGLDDYHLLHAARADLLRRLGRRPEAADAYRKALALDPNPVERKFLERRLLEMG
jgi:RNA polymerase sigma factor (sigma-70 family)